MGQVRHGSATTTHAIRAAIQRSHASLATLSRELGINPKTVAKWRKRATVEDLKTGPKEPCSTTMSAEEEAMVGECPAFCVSVIWSMLPERSQDDDDLERTAGRAFEGLRAT